MEIANCAATALGLGTRVAEERSCREFLWNARWPNGFICPKCQGHRAGANSA